MYYYMTLVFSQILTRMLLCVTVEFGGSGLGVNEAVTHAE